MDTTGKWDYKPESTDYVCGERYKECYAGVIHSEEGDMAIAVIINDCVDGKANAERIVKAVNCHNDLVEALNSWSELWDMRPLDSGEDMQQILRRCWAKTSKAISKAETL